MTYDLILDLSVSTLLCIFGYFVGWKQVVKPSFEDAGLIKEQQPK
jgi:hypothetical protein